MRPPDLSRWLGRRSAHLAPGDDNQTSSEPAPDLTADGCLSELAEEYSPGPGCGAMFSAWVADPGH
jgi:hypothetical protein